jgi:hypothetical protein
MRVAALDRSTLIADPIRGQEGETKPEPLLELEFRAYSTGRKARWPA